MRPGLATLVLAALFVLAVLTVDLQDAYNARAHPLTGQWAAEFVMDSGTPRPGDSIWRPQPGARASGVVRLRTGAPGWLSRADRLWRAAFIGTHSVDFAPVLGYAASQRDALGLRLGADSVRLYLNGYCCHTGGVGARGRIEGNSAITGRWATDSDGWTAWGRFVLRRASGNPRAPAA